MTKEKWYEIFSMICANFQKKLWDLDGQVSAETWHIQKKFILQYIAEVDQATEVYEMENRSKK